MNNERIGMLKWFETNFREICERRGRAGKSAIELGSHGDCTVKWYCRVFRV